jgi:hypothetical protein
VSDIGRDEVRALVDRTVDATRLNARDKAAVRQDLENHFLDGTAAGVPLREIVRDFGDPMLTAHLITRSKRTHQPALFALTLAAAIVAMIYSVAVFRLHTAPPWSGATAIDGEAAEVVGQAARVDSLLTTPGGIPEGFAVAASLRGRRNLWSEPTSLVLLDRAMSAADSLLPRADREALLLALRALEREGALHLDTAVIASTMPLLVDRLYAVNGRIDRDGLRLLQRTKGVAEPGGWALLLEPFFFAPSWSRTKIDGALRYVIRERFGEAEKAAVRLVARL